MSDDAPRLRVRVRVVRMPTTSEQLDRWYRDHDEAGDGSSWSTDDEQRRIKHGTRRIPPKPPMH